MEDTNTEVKLTYKPLLKLLPTLPKNTFPSFSKCWNVLILQSPTWKLQTKWCYLWELQVTPLFDYPPKLDSIHAGLIMGGYLYAFFYSTKCICLARVFYSFIILQTMPCCLQTKVCTLYSNLKEQIKVIILFSTFSFLSLKKTKLFS